jgi:phage-related protein
VQGERPDRRDGSAEIKRPCSAAPYLLRLDRAILVVVYCLLMGKPLRWLGSSRRDIRAFPLGARRVAGFQLLRVQQGMEPSDWKPMATVGAGVREIRVHTETEHRVCYVARFAEAIYVLHAFEKRTRKTPTRDIELARTRYQELLAWRREQDYG